MTIMFRLLLQAADGAERAFVRNDVTPAPDNRWVYYTRHPNLVGGIRFNEGNVSQWVLPESGYGQSPMPFCPSVDPDSGVWFAVASRPVLSRLSTDSNQLLQYGPLPIQHVSEIGCDDLGRVWFRGADRIGVLFAQRQAVRTWTLPAGLRKLRALWVERGAGAPWIAGVDERSRPAPFVARLSPDSGTLTGWTLSPSPASDRLRVAADPERGVVWMSAPDFAFRLEIDSGHVHVFPHNPGSLYDLDVAPDGAAWLGRFDGYLEKVMPDAECAKGDSKPWRIRLAVANGRARLETLTATHLGGDTDRTHPDLDLTPGPCSTLYRMPAASMATGVAAATGSVYFVLSNPLAIVRLDES